MDVAKHIAYWRDGALEDIDVARELLERGRHRYALFFAHLAVEKMLKAHMVRKTEAVPPKIHNLLRLAQLSDLAVDVDQSNFLKRLNAHQMEGRYPDIAVSQDNLEMEHAARVLTEAEGILEWLTREL